jgi:peptidoglycan/LPS O-acetylase OafA/YrhL
MTVSAVVGDRLAVSSHGDRNRDIEVLRAFAVGGVILHHQAVLLEGTPGLLPPGWPFGTGAGVDLFFVISGFVIGRSLLPRMAAAQPGKRQWRETLAFWVRRAFRLWPTAWVWLGVVLAVTAAYRFASPFLDFDRNVDATAAGVLHFANFRFGSVFGIEPYGATFQYWTLSLEEQFYFLLPLLVLVSRRWLAGVIIILIAIEPLRPLPLAVSITRTSALLLGVLIAILSTTQLHRKMSAAFAKAPRWLAFTLMLAGVVLVAWTAQAISTQTPGYYLVLALAAGACVLLASFNRNALGLPGPWTPVMMWIGSRSYALYVIHVPLFLVLGELVTSRLIAAGTTDAAVLLGVFAGGVALTTLLAELNYRLVEMPLRRFGVAVSDGIARGRGGVAVLTPAHSHETAPVHGKRA